MREKDQEELIPSRPRSMAGTLAWISTLDVRHVLDVKGMLCLEMPMMRLENHHRRGAGEEEGEGRVT